MVILANLILQMFLLSDKMAIAHKSTLNHTHRNHGGGYLSQSIYKQEKNFPISIVITSYTAYSIGILGIWYGGGYIWCGRGYLALVLT